MVITEDIIKCYTDDITYRRGLKYYENGLVNELEVGEDEGVTEIVACVDSSSGFKSYDVQISIINKNNIMKFYCNCPAFDEYYYSRGICKHLVATLIKYMKEYSQKGTTSEKNSSPIDTLINQLKTTVSAGSRLRRELKLDIHFSYAKWYKVSSFVELKVGLDKLYVVRNAREFLNAIESESTYEFGKGFTYNPYEQRFSEADTKIIELFSEINELSQNIESSNNYYGKKSLISGKEVSIQSKQMRRFFEAVAERDEKISINILEDEYKNVNVLKENLPLKFDLSYIENKISISQEEMPMPLNKDGDVFWYQNNIYLPTQEQVKNYMPFYNMFMHDSENKITFNKSEGEKIAAYVVPALKKLTESVKLDKHIKESFYEEPLVVKTYLDKVGEYVTAYTVFNYGEVEINDFEKENDRPNDKILIRDIEKEENVDTVLKSFGFQREKEQYFMKDEKNVVSFITEGVNKLQELGEVYYSEAFKNIKVYGKSSIRASVSISDGDLLEFSFELEGVNREELRNIFNAIKEKKKYFRLKNGGLVDLQEKEIKDIADMIEYLNVKDSDLNKDKILLSKYNSLYIDQKIKDQEMDFIKRSKDFRELTNNIRDVKDMDYVLPQHLETVMRKYQNTGFKWFKVLSAYGFGGILADEMGLGKTLQAIAFMVSEKGSKPSLIISPTSLVYNWQSEIDKFAPELKTVVISGNKKQREELRNDIDNCDVVITSYPLIRRDIEEYKDIDFNYCIIDEAQQIKNPNSQNAASVKEIKAKGYFALTGTPMENSLTELWSIFDFIMPGYLLTSGKFSKLYETPIVKNGDKAALEELNKHIKPFILRRMKKDVIKELPPKIEHKLIVDMTEEQKKVYAAYLGAAKEEINEEIKNKGFGRSKIKILSVLTRLRQICCDPSVFMEDFKGESGKYNALDELLEESIGEGHKILLFSQFTSVLKNISHRLVKCNIKHMYLDGQTKSEMRMDMVKQFNEGDADVFLISLKAGGTGLNLTGADVVIHFDPWWNPAVEEQASDRAHRIGQKKTVEVIKLIAQGTIEEKIFKLQEKKKEVIKNIIDKDMNEDNVITEMTQEELESLFK